MIRIALLKRGALGGLTGISNPDTRAMIARDQQSEPKS